MCPECRALTRSSCEHCAFWLALRRRARKRRMWRLKMRSEAVIAVLEVQE